MCSSFNCSTSEFRAWANTLTQDKILLVTERDITLKPHLYGEDYYIYTLLKELKKTGIYVDIAVFPENSMRFYEQRKMKRMQDIEPITKSYDAIILHNVSPFKLLRAKFKYKFKLIMPVYFVWNKSSPAISNVRWLVGDTLWQLIVNEFIATSPTVVRGLKIRGIFKKIRLIPPVYRCEYCDLRKNRTKLIMLKKRFPKNVKAVYIGSLNHERLPLVKIENGLNSNNKRVYEVDIYTATPTKERTYEIGNVRVNIVRKILSDEEKCIVLCQSHLFIAPKRGTTMEPSISVIEAKHHGNVVVYF